MLRMLLVGYLYGIRSERRLVEEIHLNLAYRWFCKLGLESRVPDRSALSAGPTPPLMAAPLTRMAEVSSGASCRGWWRSPFKIGAAMPVGEFGLLALGTLWLMYLFGLSQGIEYGIGHFIVPDLLKLAIAAGLVSVFGNVVRKLSRSR